MLMLRMFTRLCRFDYYARCFFHAYFFARCRLPDIYVATFSLPRGALRARVDVGALLILRRVDADAASVALARVDDGISTLFNIICWHSMLLASAATLIFSRFFRHYSRLSVTPL